MLNLTTYQQWTTKPGYLVGLRASKISVPRGCHSSWRKSQPRLSWILPLVSADGYPFRRISHGVNREENSTEFAKNIFISLLLLLLLILSCIGDTVLLSLIKISCFDAAVDLFCYHWILFDIPFFSCSSASN